MNNYKLLLKIFIVLLCLSTFLHLPHSINANDLTLGKSRESIHLNCSRDIQEELSHIPVTAKVNIYFEKGIYAIREDLSIPSDFSLHFSEGAILNIDPNKKVIIKSNIMAGEYQIFSGKGSVVFGPNNTTEARPQWWKSPEENGYTASIQKALLSQAKVVYLSSGTYDIDIPKNSKYAITIPSNIVLKGNEGNSVLKLRNCPKTKDLWDCNSMFMSEATIGIKIMGLSFDSSSFYPDPSTISRQDPNIVGTRALAFFNVRNLTIERCLFKGFTNHSISVTGDEILLQKNRFNQGSYRTQVIRLDNSKNVTVSNNVFEDNGPHYYMVPGRPHETSSTDAIMVGYHVEHAYILKNIIKKTSGCGIRVEMSKDVHVIGNEIYDAGQDGITFYHTNKDCTCIGNTVQNWGRLVNFGYIRKQDGVIYNPKEYHYPPPGSPNLPGQLAGAATWEKNRYYLQDRDKTIIPDYDMQDYKTVLAFRGFSGISVTQVSYNITISRNKIIGNKSMTDGLYNYASNYGINIGVHNVNPPTSSGNCIVTNNAVSDSIDYDIYCPEYVDPHSRKGIAKESVVFGNTCSPTKTMFFYQKNPDAACNN